MSRPLWRRGSGEDRSSGCILARYQNSLALTGTQCKPEGGEQSMALIQSTKGKIFRGNCSPSDHKQIPSLTHLPLQDPRVSSPQLKSYLCPWVTSPTLPLSRNSLPLDTRVATLQRLSFHQKAREPSPFSPGCPQSLRGCGNSRSCYLNSPGKSKVCLPHHTLAASRCLL